jgi:hypothetical protein
MAASRDPRRAIDWAGWSTRRVLAVGLLYGVGMGCLLGVTIAWVDHRARRDTIELIGFDVGLWCVFAVVGLFGIRWLARHPRRRASDRDR